MKLKPTPPLKRSHWMREAGLLEAVTEPLSGVRSADIVIVGGGFVGLWTALTIKEREPDARVIVLEQDIAGGGASGRNGGFVMSWWPKIGTLRSFCSVEEALFLGRAAEQAIGDLGRFCEQHEIDAHFRQGGWLWTATTPAHVESWNSTVEACEALGVKPFERLSPQEVARRTGSAVHLAGVFERSNATVQPALLALGMRRVALAQGVQIHERSAVTALEPGEVVTVRTVRGSVTARQVVLATNAWAAVMGGIGSMICPVNSTIVATAAMADRLARAGWEGGESITDSQLMVDYYRTTRDGRIVFGKGTGAIRFGSAIEGSVFSEDGDSARLTEADLRRTYPDLSDVPVLESWSGPLDRTYDSLPVFGQIEGQKNIHFGIGWSGNGVGPSRLGGRILASLALQQKDEWSTCPLVGRKARRFPPEPFRNIGGNLVRDAVIRKERAELAGARGRWLDRYLAKLAPSGLEDKE